MGDRNWSPLFAFAAGGLSAVASIAIYRAVAARTIKKAATHTATKKWIAGENQPLPFAKGTWKGYSFDDLKKAGSAYSLLISTVVPRPIALISSQNADGQLNCAPYSYFNTVCHDPPLIVVGINLNGRTVTKKDTLNNIEQTGKLAVSYAT
jgi:hypothetical protein